MSLRTADYDYPLPEHLIARHPLARRDASRMMVLDPLTQTIEHRYFAEFPSLLAPGDLCALNDTRVIPARVFSDDGRIEMLFLETTGPNTWRCLVKPGRKMKLGAGVQIRGVGGVVHAIEPEGERLIQFDGLIDLDAAGELPLPPYFARPIEPEDVERYQTVYARAPGAVAAPTAGLHFTPDVLAKVPHVFLTLHVGVGTFRPVQVDDLSGHRMHTEHFTLPEASAEALNQARRVVAIGTTTTRVLETLGRPFAARQSETDIFIHPPHRFRAVDALLTNFHLPKSTLLMLVSALAGREFVLDAYREAIREDYRFYSYGDCMFIRHPLASGA